MVRPATDPITGTTWFDPSDLQGSLMTIVFGIIGIGLLFGAINVARGTVTPLVDDAASAVPGVSAGDGGGIRFD